MSDDNKKYYLTQSEYDKMEYKDYENQLNDDDKQWIQQFYEEYYADLASFVPEEERVIKSKEILQEARRNHNNLKRDMFDKARKMGNLTYSEEDAEFMEAASKEWEWRDAYTVGGEELAVNAIMFEARKELMDEPDDQEEWFKILARFYVKMNELRKLKQRQQKRNYEGKK